LDEAQIAVMWLDAMARVTKIPLAKLEDLSKTSAIFAPGAENYVRLGALEAVISAAEFMPRVNELLNLELDIHHWRTNGLQRGGRSLAATIVEHILAQ
jgi:malonate decarboxylase gamma subunit